MGLGLGHGHVQGWRFGMTRLWKDVNSMIPLSMVYMGIYYSPAMVLMLLVIFGHTVYLAQLQLDILLYGILRSIVCLPQATTMIVIFNRGIETEARKTTSSSLRLVVFSTHTNQRSLTPISATNSCVS